MIFSLLDPFFAHASCIMQINHTRSGANDKKILWKITAATYIQANSGFIKVQYKSFRLIMKSIELSYCQEEISTQTRQVNYLQGYSKLKHQSTCCGSLKTGSAYNSQKQFTNYFKHLIQKVESFPGVERGFLCSGLKGHLKTHSECFKIFKENFNCVF